MRRTAVEENRLEGAAASEWDVNGQGDPSIQGFAHEISIQPGESLLSMANCQLRRDRQRTAPAAA